MTKRPARLDLNPSSADRWTTCTASPRFIMENWDKVPPSETAYNQEGTTAHEVAAAMLQGNYGGLDSNGKYCEAYTDEMFWHGWKYAEYVESLRQPGSRLLVEQKLPLWYMRERNAIVDAAVLNPGSLHVVDYKYGEGVPVSPEGNLQTAIYAVSVGLLSGQPLPTDFPVFIHIFQPRGRAAEEGASHVWETTWLEICKLTEKVTQVAEDIQADIPYGLAMFAPSEKACRWCPAKGFCQARQASLADGLEVLDDQPRPLPSPGVLAEEQVRRILHHKEEMVKWLNDVEQWAEDFLKGGGKIQGFKLVQSRGGNRYWSDPKQAGALLIRDTVLKWEEVIEEKVISPKAAEDLVGKRKFSAELTNLIAKPPGAPVIAPISDKREAIGSVADDFEILPEQTTQTNNT